MNNQKATLIGFCAIILWSSMIALIKVVSNSFGVIGGAALIYTCSSILLIFTIGLTPIKEISKKYLLIGGSLFITYEIFLVLSIGYTENNQQAIEIGMINYLWPTFTIITSIIFNKYYCNWIIMPGVTLSFVGILLVLGDHNGININLLIDNIQNNPKSYILSFIGAIVWSAYCVCTAKIAKGKNGITLFFISIAVLLWILYFYQEKNTLHFNITSICYLILSAITLGFGYAAWNIGMLHGNVMALATASYFTPVFSTLISSILLHTDLSFTFWQGVCMVSIGAFFCFIATNRNKVQSNQN